VNSVSDVIANVHRVLARGFMRPPLDSGGLEGAVHLPGVRVAGEGVLAVLQRQDDAPRPGEADAREDAAEAGMLDLNLVLGSGASRALDRGEKQDEDKSAVSRSSALAELSFATHASLAAGDAGRGPSRVFAVATARVVAR
jgi:hypothetical protein